LGTGRTVKAIAQSSNWTACAILDTNQLKCWGVNDFGQLGYGDTHYRGYQPHSMGDNLPPVPLGTGRTAIDVATGISATCAVLATGGVKCWGYSEYGELGA